MWPVTWPTASPSHAPAMTIPPVDPRRCDLRDAHDFPDDRLGNRRIVRAPDQESPVWRPFPLRPDISPRRMGRTLPIRTSRPGGSVWPDPDGRPPSDRRRWWSDLHRGGLLSPEPDAPRRVGATVHLTVKGDPDRLIVTGGAAQATPSPLSVPPDPTWMESPPVQCASS